MMSTMRRAAIAAAALAVSSAAFAQVTTGVYRGFGTSDGTPFSDLAGTLHTPAITFATDTGYAWHPFGLDSFGSQSTGFLAVASAGTYSFTLDSDDGSTLYIDGSLVVNNSGAHAPTALSGSATLAAGTHSFTVNFFEDFGGPSGVDLLLPAGVTYAVPEPETLALMLAGLAVVGTKLRRRSA